MDLKAITKQLAFHLDDDVLAIHIQEFVFTIIKVLVGIYVASQMAGEIVQPYLTQLGELFTYKIPQMGDVTDAVQQETT